MNNMLENQDKLDDLVHLVPGVNQVSELKYILEGKANGSPKILIMGNSMTRHAPKPDIGWYNDWGMAASSKENDYVHQTIKSISEKYPNASFCYANMSEWEVKQKDFNYDDLAAAADYAPDITVFFLGANTPKENFDKASFKKCMKKLLERPAEKNPENKVICMTGFHYNELKYQAITEYSKENGTVCLSMHDLGYDPNNHALGQFEHQGICHHPNDIGMKKIADRLSSTILELLK